MRATGAMVAAVQAAIPARTGWLRDHSYRAWEPAAAEQLRSALAMGADRAILLKGQPSVDGLATAKALAAEIRDAGADLVLLGMKASDDDQQQVGPMLAEVLGLPAEDIAQLVADGIVREPDNQQKDPAR